MRRRRTPERQAELIRQGGELVAITQHPSWPTLLRVVEEEREKIRRVVLAQALGGRGPVNAEEIIFHRGVLHGMNYMVLACLGAERKLEDLLQEAARMEEAS